MRAPGFCVACVSLRCVRTLSKYARFPQAEAAASQLRAEAAVHEDACRRSALLRRQALKNAARASRALAQAEDEVVAAVTAVHPLAADVKAGEAAEQQELEEATAAAAAAAASASASEEASAAAAVAARDASAEDYEGARGRRGACEESLALAVANTAAARKAASAAAEGLARSERQTKSRAKAAASERRAAEKLKAAAVKAAAASETACADIDAALERSLAPLMARSSAAKEALTMRLGRHDDGEAARRAAEEAERCALEAAAAAALDEEEATAAATAAAEAELHAVSTKLGQEDKTCEEVTNAADTSSIQ